MPTFIKTTAGGKAVSGGSLNPRGRRGNTAQVASYWAGGGGLTPPATVEYLVVAGGGGTGGNWQGGGGAGGYRTAAGLAVSDGTTYTVTVGAGGSNANGSDSVFGSITSTGGGRGGTYQGGAGSSGGSGGGGAGSQSSAGSGGAGNTPSTSPSQGSNGGNGYADFNYPNSGGGGGAGGNGANAILGNQGVDAAGGIGVSSSITGSSVTRGVGGKGTRYQEGSANGANNTGNGGSASLGNGGSGFVVIKYADSADLPTISAGLTYSASISGGFRIIQFTAGTGTVIW